MDDAQSRLNDQIDDATQRLLSTARLITDSDLRQPSLLPGWTRGHVLAHVARNADAMRNLLVGARSGEDRQAYPSAQAREADIEQGARASARDLVTGLADSAMAFRTIARQLTAEAWAFPVRILDSAPFPASQLLIRRLVEVGTAPLRSRHRIQSGRLASRLHADETGRADALPAPGPPVPPASSPGPTEACAPAARSVPPAGLTPACSAMAALPAGPDARPLRGGRPFARRPPAYARVPRIRSVAGSALPPKN